MKVRFDNPTQFPEPQILLMNTKSTSKSVQGMDLWATDLTLVNDGCELQIMRQVTGRILRQRKRRKTMKDWEKFERKRVVLMSMPVYRDPNPLE